MKLPFKANVTVNAQHPFGLNLQTMVHTVYNIFHRDYEVMICCLRMNGYCAVTVTLGFKVKTIYAKMLIIERVITI